MIFGMTHSERTAKQNLKRQWKRHFAIFPVRLENGQFAWLQWVERKKCKKVYRSGYFRYYRLTGDTND